MVQSRTDHCYSFDQISTLKKDFTCSAKKKVLFFESIELMIRDILFLVNFNLMQGV